MNKRNVFIMYAISFFQGMVFYSSIATLYRTSHGLTLVEMGLIESLFSIMVFIFEVPWGYICDRIGYKKTLLICNFLYVLSKIVFYQAYSFNSFLLERILLALVVSGLSGCDIAFLYLSSGKDDNPKIFGYFHSLGTLGLIISSLMFSFFIQEDYSKAGYWTIFPFIIAFVLTFFLEDIKKEKTTHFSFSNSIKEFISQKKIILFLVASSLILETTHTIYIFYSQLQYQRSGIPVAYYGIIYIGITIISLSGATIGKITKKINEYHLIRLLFTISIIVCLILTFTSNPFLSILFIAILAIVEALYIPLNDSILNRQVNSASRVTMLSIYSMFMNIPATVTNIVFGKYADSSTSSVMFVGVIFLSIGLSLYLVWHKCKTQGN